MKFASNFECSPFRAGTVPQCTPCRLRPQVITAVIVASGAPWPPISVIASSLCRMTAVPDDSTPRTPRPQAPTRGILAAGGTLERREVSPRHPMRCQPGRVARDADKTLCSLWSFRGSRLLRFGCWQRPLALLWHFETTRILCARKRFKNKNASFCQGLM